MRKLMMVLVGFALFAGAGVAYAGMCGIKPIKPITPNGCRDLVAVCVFDQYGNNCVWTWQCVAR